MHDEDGRPRAPMIAVANAGSSSLKFSLYDWDGADGLSLRLRGLVEEMDTRPVFSARDAQGRELARQALDGDRRWGHDAALHHVIEFVRALVPGIALAAIGHRVVHGGVSRAAPARVTAQVLDELEALTPLAPLHQPGNLSPIRLAMQLLPEVPQVACFDTAFHRSQPELAQMFALPAAWHREGVRRYGFHGLSYDYIASRLPQVDPALADARVVAMHLGNGASMCALRGGRSVASTMGFTALDGLPMGTRCGAIDPGVLLYLMQQRGMSAQQVETLLYRESGLLGVSGLSSDMRVLSTSDSPQAALAIDLFAYRIVREVGSLAAALGGLDALVFTAGIGEHAPPVRQRVLDRLGWLGFVPDPARNAANGPRITTDASPRAAWVIPTDEEWTVARQTIGLLRG